MSISLTRRSAIAYGFLAISTAFAGDVGRLPGAGWTYEMEPVEGKGARKGKFRINGDKIFQSREMKPTVVGKIIGKGGEKTKTVKIEFDSLGGDDGKQLNAKGSIEYDSPGEVHGRLVDADGKHWKFKASRAQE